MSGGWKQRLALSACILHEPDILLLDEPTAGVDPKARREFWDEINRLSDNGLTVLVSTHYMDEAERCHEIVYIAYGNIMAQGTVEQVIAKTGLKTFDITGGQTAALRLELEGCPDITTMALFGEHLHICGPDAEKLKTVLTRRADGCVWHEIPTTLEDAFIYYLKNAKEN